MRSTARVFQEKRSILDPGERSRAPTDGDQRELTASRRYLCRERRSVRVASLRCQLCEKKEGKTGGTWTVAAPGRRAVTTGGG